MKSYYITTTLPYVNAEPHIGFALEILAADVLARLHRGLGYSVCFNTGTDEHGQKIYDKSLEAKLSPQAFVDHHAQEFLKLKELLDLSFDTFIRTTDAHHVAAAQEFWKRCDANGFIYKKMYSLSYCVGCELEKQASELVDGTCPIHPNLQIKVREEENYFFRFSAFQERLLQLYADQPEFVKPKSKMREIESFVSNGLQDFSISRLKSKMPWGIDVPNDSEHVMYVWFDALVNYISTLGWPDDSSQFNNYWPAVQIAGKDNLRQQSAMWQAMLMAADLPPSKEILINGFISVAGQKMSKSLGNVISPSEMVERYGTDATRFLLIHLGPVAEDIDVTWQRFDEDYTAILSNGLGNLCSRIAKLASQIDLNEKILRESTPDSETTQAESLKMLASYQFNDYTAEVLAQLNALDGYLSEHKPWLKDGLEKTKIVGSAVAQLIAIVKQLEPSMPSVTSTIMKHFSQAQISPIAPLFPRIDKR